MRTWNVTYKWASGTGVAERVTPPLDVHGGHQAVVTIRTPNGNTRPTRTRIRRAIVADLTRDAAHGDSFAWRVKRKISVLAQRTAS